MFINLYAPSAGCVQCNSTKKKLDAIGATYTVFKADPTEDVDHLLGDAIRDRANEQGLGQQFPFVQVFNTKHELVMEWCGFRPDKIEELQAALS
ncbi:thioredoxin domain-containing protein [Glutamicibacter ardleyensis]|uniref:NrdH-redoxin n=1 Tax=Glutamicibacter ardleyensis TaxID=225894 RepID=A0ABQ2DFN8_9MICC|nr:NrdH-redoxin [Glutamicibacter ardleyensis]GGJ56141.1 hypothetical protein GCM10007173_13680 [Glutamicibacter ardleyensis]